MRTKFHNATIINHKQALSKRLWKMLKLNFHYKEDGKGAIDTMRPNSAGTPWPRRSRVSPDSRRAPRTNEWMAREPWATRPRHSRVSRVPREWMNGPGTAGPWQQPGQRGHCHTKFVPAAKFLPGASSIRNPFQTCLSADDRVVRCRAGFKKHSRSCCLRRNNIIQLTDRLITLVFTLYLYCI